MNHAPNFLSKRSVAPYLPQATKRWWQCGGCRYRFATLGQRYPHARCAK